MGNRRGDAESGTETRGHGDAVTRRSGSQINAQSVRWACPPPRLRFLTFISKGTEPCYFISGESCLRLNAHTCSNRASAPPSQLK